MIAARLIPFALANAAFDGKVPSSSSILHLATLAAASSRICTRLLLDRLDVPRSHAAEHITSQVLSMVSSGEPYRRESPGV